MWESLMEDTPSPRDVLVHNIDDIWQTGSITVGEWKVIKGASPYQGKWDEWYGPSGRDYRYDINKVFQSSAGKAFKKLNIKPTLKEIELIRRNSTISCPRPEQIINCDSVNEPCLYNVKEDPCEFYNLAEIYPDKLGELLNMMEKVNRTAIPPSNREIDSRADPRYWSNTWTNFGDFI